MSEDDPPIAPALNLSNDSPTEMSSAEFQRKLYSWFEDRGLLSELRAHLRKQMIGVLKDTALGRTVSAQQKQTISPKLQALNLLIAEFLLQQDYHYSLSVFSTEVPLISVLPEFPGLGITSQESKKWKFSEKDMWDILETLGVQSSTDEGKNIFYAYYKSLNQEPLLTCIVRMLHNMQSKSRTNLTEAMLANPNPSNSNIEAWMRTVKDILNRNGVSPQSTDEVVVVLKGIVNAEKKRLADEAKLRYVKLQAQLEMQVFKREEQQKKKYTKIHQDLQFEKEHIQAELSRKQYETDKYELKLQQNQSTLQDRYEEMLAREKQLLEREMKLQVKEEQVGTQEQSLQAAFRNLQEEQNKATILQDRLQQELKEKQETAKIDARFLQGLQEECKTMKTQIVTTQEAVLNASRTSLSNEQPSDKGVGPPGLIQQLQAENHGLRSLNSEQQIRINELSERASILIRNLEDTHAPYGGHHLPRSEMLSVPSVMMAVRPRLNDENTFSGAGEQGSRPSRRRSALRESPSYYNELRDDGRRCVPPRRLTVHSSSGSDDFSPTNDALREAHARLRRLEQESQEVDNQYRKFKAKQGRENCFSRKLNTAMGGSWLGALEKEFGPHMFTTEAAPDVFTYLSQSRDVYDQPHCSAAGIGLSSPDNNAGTSKLRGKKIMNLTHCTTKPYFFQSNHRLDEPCSSKDRNVPDADKVDQQRDVDNQSVASSGVLNGLLGNGSLGGSFSEFDASDEKSDLQSKHSTERS